MRKGIAICRRRGVVSVAVATCVAYLALAISFSLLTPAWENSDEPSHVAYVEHVARSGAPPRISLANGMESHQAPLYYYLTAGWQRLVGIEPFTPNTPPDRGVSTFFTSGIYAYAHDYTPAQQHQATSVHLLRIVSVACGLATVLAALATGWLLSGNTAFTAAVGATVALWPKFVVVTAAVTNIALVVALCACAVPCFLLWRRDRRPIWAAATGAVLGAAALTGELALPVAGLMLLLMLGQAWRRREWRGALVAVGCFVAIAGWWYVRNVVLYGDPLAGAATRDYLAHAVGPGPLIRTPPSLSPDVLSSGFTTLVHSAWYDGGWNQIHLPTTVDLVVSAIAAVSLLLTAFLAHLRGGLVLVLCAIGSVVGWLLLLRSTTQGEGRYLLVAIVAWAVFLVAGSERLIRRRAGLWLWPILLGALDGYVLLRWLVPYAHL